MIGGGTISDDFRFKAYKRYIVGRANRSLEVLLSAVGAVEIFSVMVCTRRQYQTRHQAGSEVAPVFVREAASAILVFPPASDRPRGQT